MADILEDLRAYGTHQARLGELAVARGDADAGQAHLERAEAAESGLFLMRNHVESTDHGLVSNREAMALFVRCQRGGRATDTVPA